MRDARSCTSASATTRTMAPSATATILRSLDLRLKFEPGSRFMRRSMHEWEYLILDHVQDRAHEAAANRSPFSILIRFIGSLLWTALRRSYSLIQDNHASNVDTATPSY